MSSSDRIGTILETFQLLKKEFENDSTELVQISQLEVSFKLKHYQQVSEEIGAEYAVWSLLDDIGSLYGTHTYGNVSFLIYKQNGKMYCTGIDGDTWIDLFKAADTLLKESEDFQNVFIENFTPDGIVLFLHTGS